jgi:hypothetical protein
LDLEGPRPPRGGCRGSPVTHWGVVDRWDGDNISQWHYFRGTPGLPRGGPGVAFGFWPAGRRAAVPQGDGPGPGGSPFGPNKPKPAVDQNFVLLSAIGAAGAGLNFAI